ncbi:MAG: DnaD domain protein [Thermomicrobium sp.]|nr:DnaD domain protein [Thermomicrobium sp.]MDW7981669.1 DnaD domain protein [Thermomicrobium sp.]
MDAKLLSESSYCLPVELADRLVTAAHDLDTVKVVLTVARLTARAGASAVPLATLSADPGLRRALRPRGTDRDPESELLRAVNVAVARGFLVLLRTTNQRGTTTDWVALATPETIALARRAPVSLLPTRQGAVERVTVERPNAFALYEQNIGPLTPLIAEQLADALEQFPASWVEAAITEAVHYGRRNWRYIQRILERWATEGRHDEAHSRDQRARQLDPEKYLRGKYAPLFNDPE